MGTPVPSRKLSLLVLCASALLIIVDSTIVTVALPTIREELRFTESGLAWVVNAYLLSFAGLLLVCGRIADIVGPGRVFTCGLALFTLASLLCGIATTRAELIGCRFLQGAGGALSSAVALGMLTSMYPARGERARALAVFSFVTAAGSSLGLILGGIITQALTWRWVFWANLPIGVLATALAWRLFIEARRPAGNWSDVDFGGALLVTGGLVGLVYAVVEAENVEWYNGTRVINLIASAGLLLGFAVRQWTATRPLIPPRLLADRGIVAANSAIALMLAGLFGFQFLTALYLRDVLGFSPLETGLAFLPGPLGTGLATLGLSARLIDRFGRRTVAMLGLGMIAVSLSWLSRIDTTSSYAVDLAPAFGGIGLGFGFAMPALMNAAMANADETDSGIASALVSATQQIGGAIGVAVLATLSAARTHAFAGSGEQLGVALSRGFGASFGVSAGLTAVALLICWISLQPQDGPAAHERLGPSA